MQTIREVTNSYNPQREKWITDHCCKNVKNIPIFSENNAREGEIV